MPQGMCYSHFGNGVRNGAISISQLMITVRYLNIIRQWGKIMITVLPFARGAVNLVISI